LIRKQGVLISQDTIIGIGTLGQVVILFFSYVLIFRPNIADCNALVLKIYGIFLRSIPVK
ncbi:hypothetical protein JYT18_00070, partial [Desulfocapsa sp. AH-315-J15]|nr:hypothetical protein [Desulfocapsa sp. AH-315-J15]